MKVIIASDFSGFRLKQAVKNHLIKIGYEVDDVGQQTEAEQVPYYEAASNLARAMQSGKYTRGIVICGTGAGVSLIVNKFKGIYCVACESVYTAEKISLINNANVLAMGEKVVSLDMGAEMAEKFLSGIWCKDFTAERKENNRKGFARLQEIEAENFK
ncbi:MAG TPA: RpiB/LacA/LacB family sugar-phosphate isomerase [Bacillota bacterium]